MPLNLYRRHHRTLGKCDGGHKPDSISYEADELRRGRKKCHCPIYAGGTLGGQFHRKNTKKITWEEAKTVVAAWEQAGTWDAAEQAIPVPAPPSPADSQSSGRVSIKQAVEAFEANRTLRGIRPSTLRQYKTMTKQLQAFADERGYVMLDQFTVPDLDAFYASWKNEARSRGKKLEKLKGFFSFCVKRKWLAENTAEHLESPVGAGSPANRIPFTDEELRKIYSACDRLPKVQWTNGLGSGVWDGEDVKSMIMLLCWTGLRISDGATFNMSRVTPHPQGGANVFLRMHKTRGSLSTWIDDWLYARLKERARVLGPRIFALGTSERLESNTDLWRRKINKAFELAGTFECGRPTPHIFRHTFARLLLQRGVSPRDVAELLGDTEDVVLKHYARWVPERQERLTNILREKLAEAPKPLNVVSIGKRHEAPMSTTQR